MGNPTGFYELDLSEEHNRIAARMIAEHANHERRMAKSRGRDDTSQKGNWENFRNEIYMGKPFTLTSKFFNNIPHQGHLQFDYVSTTLHQRSAKPMSMNRFMQLRNKLELEYLERAKEDYQRAFLSECIAKLDQIQLAEAAASSQESLEVDQVSTGVAGTEPARPGDMRFVSASNNKEVDRRSVFFCPSMFNFRDGTAVNLVNVAMTKAAERKAMEQELQSLNESLDDGSSIASGSVASGDIGIHHPQASEDEPNRTFIPSPSHQCVRHPVTLACQSPTAPIAEPSGGTAQSGRHHDLA